METQAKEKYIAAIDIGTTKIVAVCGKVHRQPKTNKVEKIEVLSYGISKARGMKRGMIHDLKQVIDSIREAATEAKFYDDLNVREVYVGISGYTVRSFPMQHHRLIPQGKIEQRDVEILTNEVYQTAVNKNEEVLHVIPYNFVIDEAFEHSNPVGLEGRRLDGTFYLIVSDLKFVRGIRTAVKEAGFETKKIVFEPLASAEAVLKDEEKEAGVALVDIGGGTTDLVVYHDNYLIFSKVIPFGGESITLDIKNAFEILHSKAEEVKIKYGSAIATKKMDHQVIEIPGIAGRPPLKVSQYTLSVIIQARATEIIDTIYEHIKHFKEDKKLAAGITITGGGALLKDLPLLIKYRTGLEVRLAAPSIADVDDLNKPQYATTLGLLIKGDEYEAQMQSNDNGKTHGDDDDNDEKPGIWKKLTDWLSKLTTEQDEE